MFYFESIKIQAPNLKTPYALTLKLNDKKLYFLTCDNDKWLQNIFNFTKNKQNYESGGWIIDDYDLIHLSNSQFNNFCYQKLSYCDESTIINPNFTVNKLIKIYASFFHLEKSFINDLLKITAILTTLGYSNYKNALTFFSIFFPAWLFSVIIAGPVSLVLNKIMEWFTFSNMSLFISIPFSWIAFVVMALAFTMLFAVVFWWGLIWFKKNNLLNALKW